MYGDRSSAPESAEQRPDSSTIPVHTFLVSPEQHRDKGKKRASDRSSCAMHPEQVLDTRTLPALMTPVEFTSPDGGRVGGSHSLETLYRSAAQPISPERPTPDIAIRSAQNFTPSTAPSSEAYNNTLKMNQSNESRPHPLSQQPKSLKRQRSPSPAPPRVPVPPGHPLSEPISQRDVSIKFIDRIKRNTASEPRYAPQDGRSEITDTLVALKPSKATHVPPRAATSMTTAPRQQNTLNVPCDEKDEPTHQPATYTRDFRQGAYTQQYHPKGKMPGYRQRAPLTHIHDSASSSSDFTQKTREHSHHRNTLPPMKTQFERRPNSSAPAGHDRWRWQRQYQRGKNRDDTRKNNCDEDWDTYEPHIMENRCFEDDPDGDGQRLVHGIYHIGPPLKPLDPPPTESIAQKQQLSVLRKQEAEEYPVADTYQEPLVKKDSNTSYSPC